MQENGEIRMNLRHLENDHSKHERELAQTYFDELAQTVARMGGMFKRVPVVPAMVVISAFLFWVTVFLWIVWMVLK